MKRILLVTILLFMFFYLALVFLNKNPPAWDEAWYLSESIRLYRLLTDGNIFYFIKGYIHAIGGQKAPLISVLPLPFYLFFGTNYLSAVLVNIVLIAVMSVLIYFLTKHFNNGDDLSALFAVIIANTMPLCHQYIRMLRVEYALAVFVLIWAYHLIKSDDFNNEFYAIRLGIWLGLGLLMKSVFPIYIFGIIIFVLFRLIRSKNFERIKIALKHLCIIGIIGFLIASTWYVFNLKPMLQYATKASFGDVSHWYDVGGRNIFLTFYLYMKNVMHEGVSLFYGFLFIFCLIILLIRKKNIFKGKGFILAWIIAPIFFLLVSSNKGIQFILPVLMPFAILLAIMLCNIFKSWGLYILGIPIAICLIYPVNNFTFAKNIFLPPQINTETAPPTKKIVDLISKEQGYSYFVACAVDQDFFNDFTFNYFATLTYSPFRFYGTYHFSNLKGAISLINHSDFVIVKIGYLGPWFSNVHNDKLRELIMDKRDLFKEYAKMDAGDNSNIIVYKRIGKLSGLQ